MARKEFLDYIFKYAIEPQLGYSFSINHTLPYSIVAIQEANLATRWNPLYWQCACLCVNAGNYAGDINNDEEEGDSNSEEEEKKNKSSAPNYGKIAKAISAAQLEGVKIELPDINNSQADFVPDIENNAILYSLSAINVVNDELFDKIVENRPYSGPGDFYRRVSPTQVQMIGLIKAGCFDSLCDKPREYIMDSFLRYLAKQEIAVREKLTTVQLKKAIELKMPGLNPYKDSVRMYKFKQYIDFNQIDKPNKRYVLNDDDCVKFFNMFIREHLNPSKDEYCCLPQGKISMKISAFKREFDKAIDGLMKYLNSDEGKMEYQLLLQNNFIQNIKDKYCLGSKSKWEMDTMCFYHSGHELVKINNTVYNIKDFNSLPEYSDSKNDICAIAGTVTNADNNKHIISLLTNYGVVDVKIFAGSYSLYNQKISTIDEKTKKKTVLDDTWFKRGNKLIIYGQRKENMFTAKNYREGSYSRMIGLIENINLDGTLSVRYNRNRKK